MFDVFVILAFMMFPAVMILGAGYGFVYLLVWLDDRKRAGFVSSGQGCKGLGVDCNGFGKGPSLQQLPRFEGGDFSVDQRIPSWDDYLLSLYCEKTIQVMDAASEYYCEEADNRVLYIA